MKSVSQSEIVAYTIDYLPRVRNCAAFEAYSTLTKRGKTPMQRDMHGLAVTAASDAAVRAFDHALLGYIGYRADLADRLEGGAGRGSGFGLAHCLKGYLTMLGYNRAALVGAREAAEHARRLTARATSREQAHVAAREVWVAGHPDRAVAIWDSILTEHPQDVLAFRLAHFVNFWRGRPGPDVGIGAGGGAAMERNAARVGGAARLPLLRAGRMRQLHRRRGRRPSGDRP